MYAIRSYYVLQLAAAAGRYSMPPFGWLQVDLATLVDCDFGLACDHLLLGVKPTLTLQHVITSYSIHYTKLYEP